MAIDVYTFCPCQSGKKIKFCCGKDVVQELEQIFVRTQANQFPSALGIIDKTIDAKGEKDCLSVLKTSVLISTMQIPEAQQANESFLQRMPQNPVGLQHKAQIAARSGHVEESIEYFQDAMEAIVDSPPNCTALTTRDIAFSMARNNRIPAALALVRFISGLGEEMINEGLARLFMEIQSSTQLNLILKRELILDSPDSIEDFESHPWAKSYTNVLRLMERGQFRRALKLLHRIDEKFPDVQCVIRAIPWVMLSYGKYDGLVEALRKRAYSPETDEHDAILTLAMMLEVHDGDVVEFPLYRHEVKDIDQLTEITSTCKQLAITPAPAGQYQESEDSPPPKLSYYIFDRPEDFEIESVTVDQLTQVIGVMDVYGRQTDREARIEIVSSSWNHEQGHIKTLLEALGETIDSTGEQVTVLSQGRFPDFLLSPQIRLPLERQDFDAVTELESGYLTKHLIESFAPQKFECLDGKSLAELVAEDPGSLLVKASILRMEFSVGNHVTGTMLVDSFCDHFDIEPIPVIKSEDVEKSSALLFRFADLAPLSQAELAPLYMASSMLGDVAATRKIALEALSRDEEPVIPHQQLCIIVARSAPTFDEGIEYLNRAKNKLKEAGQPYGSILVAEFDYRLERADTADIDSLFERIRRHHIDEPDVEADMLRTLQKYNLLQTGPAPAAESAPELAATDEPVPSGIITDPAQAAPPAPKQEQSQSGLWLPGQ